MKDYYGILGVPFDATPDEIRDAYRRLAFEWHPDRNLDRRKDAHARFLDLGEAYSVLKEPRQRMEYDLSRPLADRPSAPTSSEASSGESTTREYSWDEVAAQARAAAEAAEAARAAQSFGGADLGRGPTAEEKRRADTAARSLREYRLRVRKLARELASADRRGRVVDLVMASATLATLVVALLLSAFRLIGLDLPEFRPTLWAVVIAWLTELVLLAWMFSLRERRVEQYTAYAEEVLERTGHGWAGPERADAATV